MLPEGFDHAQSRMSIGLGLQVDDDGLSAGLEHNLRLRLKVNTRDGLVAHRFERGLVGIEHVPVIVDHEHERHVGRGASDVPARACPPWSVWRVGRRYERRPYRDAFPSAMVSADSGVWRITKMASPPRTARILCIDDDRDVADVVQAILADAGYEVSCLYEVTVDAIRRTVGQLEPDCLLLVGVPGAEYG
jgi:hypothetical protein